jgi:Ran-binding protein 1
MSDTKEQEETVESPDVDFQPLVSLPLIETATNEDNEEELLKLRAKLYRFESLSDPPEWKERGVGEVKLMKNKTNSNVRLIMRRDRTHKICANHFLTKEMKLLPNAGSDRAWVWHVMADFADEQPKKEQLAIRFRNVEIAQKFKMEFEKSQDNLPSSANTSDLADDLGNLSVNDQTTGRMDETKPAGGVATESCDDNSKGTSADDNPPDVVNESDGSPPTSEIVLTDETSA